MDRRPSHELGEAGGVDSRGHGNDPKIIAELRQLQAHAEYEVSIELAFMHLVDGYGGNSFKFRIPQQAAQQNTWGNKLDVCAFAGITAHRIADALA